jgi:hypothetical protein
MGKLLDLGIQASQIAGTPPTLTVTLDFLGGQTGYTQIYKNGVIYSVLSSTGSSVIVPIIAGDTYQYIIGSTQQCFYRRYINAILQESGDVPSTYTSSLFTASVNQIILINTFADTP